MQINVRGGTNAGWRVVKQVARKNWICPVDGKSLRYYWRRCPSCGHPRPE